MNNLEISWIFLEIADLLEIKGDNPFKIRSYQQAARLLAELDEDISVYWANGCLTELPGIGPALASKIEELLDTGQLSYLNELRREVPAQLRQLLAVPGIGPKTVHTIYKHLGVITLKELKAAACAQQLRDLPGLGTKSELAIKHAIDLLDSDRQGLPLGEAATVAYELAEAIGQLPSVVRIAVAGEVRRREEFVQEALLLAAANLNNVSDILTTFSSAPYVRKIISMEKNKVTVLLGIGLHVQLVVVDPSAFHTSLCYFTGPLAHWENLSLWAKQRGFELTASGLFSYNCGQPLTLQSEEELYHRLGLMFIVPELRSGREDVLAAANGTLPQVITPEQIRGDLHLHTNWSDGRESIASLAKAAAQRGYEYIAITDHSQSLKIAHGLDAARLIAQAQEIRAVREQIPDLLILSGVEVDILPNGQLDLPNDVLSQLDLVIASVHSGFKQDQETMTQRIVAALRNPYVDILAHPSGRLLGRRPAYQVDLDMVINEAKLQGKILEINSSPERLDLNAKWAAKAKNLGVKLVINTDAHDARRLADIEYGVSVARRAGLEIGDVINTWPMTKLKELRKKACDA
ncbi:MAG: DNA polymerase/3'-5' exonuclease PolX [Firmicutes bacterium]|nr:DNA polymerase/3'-5' exonuclease PolX [Bacillota bacterium]